MKARLTVAAVLAVVTTPALAATAHWTGKMEFVTTVTYKQGVKCEYNYAGNTFWRTFTGASCPSTVSVQ